MKTIAPYYEIIVFTASQKWYELFDSMSASYADRILDILDADQHLIK